jgi:AcrR family transcriptional regulator
VPRLIDTEARRQAIAEAVWALIAREGLEAVSVRNVARDAGLSTGSVRHVFATQAELLAFAMRTLGERLGRRLAALPPAATPLEAAEAMLGQIVPLDAERQTEADVWFAFIARARVDPELRALGEQADALLRELVRQALEPLEPADLELAVETVYALVDGLTLHAVLNRGRPSPATMRRAVRAHLESLAPGAAASARSRA